MEIFVTRHGQTSWNALGKIQGQTDIELNDTGREQAEKTGNLIKEEKIDLIITSPLKRAKETAEIINENFNVKIIEDNRIMERSYGKCEGLTKEEREKLRNVNTEMRNIWNYSYNSTINNVETMQDFCSRIYKFLDDITEKYKDKNILLVTHGGVSIPIKCYFTKYPLKKLNRRNEEIKALKNCEIVKFSLHL